MKTNDEEACEMFRSHATAIPGEGETALESVFHIESEI